MKPTSTNPGAYLVTGQVLHERLRPVRHRFVYPVFFVRCDLDRLRELDRWWFRIDGWGPLSLRTRDYGACDGSDLAAWMRGLLTQAGIAADGPIWLQTFPRVFGLAFNPVNFWHCHDRHGRMCALLVEVRNTFGERHRYVLSAPDRGVIDPNIPLTCRKILHVSPFCRAEGRYDFRVRDTTGTSFVGIDYHDLQGLLIHTSIGGRLAPLGRGNALRALGRQPWLTILVVGGIHWQALRLFLKRVPFLGRRPAARTGDAPTGAPAPVASAADPVGDPPSLKETH